MKHLLTFIEKKISTFNIEHFSIHIYSVQSTFIPINTVRKIQLCEKKLTIKINFNPGIIFLQCINMDDDNINKILPLDTIHYTHNPTNRVYTREFYLSTSQ